MLYNKIFMTRYMKRSLSKSKSGGRFVSVSLHGGLKRTGSGSRSGVKIGSVSGTIAFTDSRSWSQADSGSYIASSSKSKEDSYF
jgi:hypothetical protein